MTGILARSRYSDSARPVIVQVTQLVCELLHMVCFHTGGVMYNNVVCRCHCTLSNMLADQEEVVPIPSGDSVVHYGSRCWIEKVSITSS